NCHKVVLYVTHGIFSKGIEVFNGLLDQLFTSDSFPQQPSDKISVIAFAAK
ncbi:ribose-phosphate pyrophosphokinase, partial [Klebsiella pneumoniae]